MSIKNVVTCDLCEKKIDTKRYFFTRYTVKAERVELTHTGHIHKKIELDVCEDCQRDIRKYCMEKEYLERGKK